MWLSIFFLLSTHTAVRLEQPDAAVRQLYAYVVVHHPLGIPAGADKDALWPLLSRRLVRQLETARACEDDYRRKHSVDGKPAFGWLETGLFSGSDEQAIPNEVKVERTESRDGAVRVYLRFSYRETSATYGREPEHATAFHWRGAAIAKLEGGHFVVDDVLLFKDNSTTIDSRLSEMFGRCSGPKWIGIRSK